MKAILWGLLFLHLPLCATQMSIEEKVGQLLVVYFEGERLNCEVEAMIQETRLGGVILYEWANGLKNPKAIRVLCTDLQSFAKKEGLAPLFIGVDQEGGKVSRLKEGFSSFPGNQAIGKTDDPERAQVVALSMGKEMQEVGINLNFAPVVDIHTRLDNPVVGSRSFGSDPRKVAIFAKCALEGYQQAGVIACLKHFPGHGGVSVDPHIGIPVVERTLDELRAFELIPFKALAQKTPLVMTAHIIFPQIDPENCATLSPTFLQTVLREEIGFDGVIVTDSLMMEGVLTRPLPEIALQAFLAGSDLLLIGGRALENRVSQELHSKEIVEVHRALVDAVEKGIISKKRLDASVERIMKLKEQLATLSGASH